MYKIIGADQKEYGPFTAAQIAQWIAENRANGQTRVQAEGSAEWRALSSFPEFAAALAGGAAPPPAGAAAAVPSSGTAPTAEEILSRGDDLFRIGSCVSRGWELLKANFGAVFGGTLLFLIFLIFIGMLKVFFIGMLKVFGNIPIVGWIVNAVGLVVPGPLSGGLYRLYLKCVRNQDTGLGEIFSGLRSGFLQLVLAYIVPGLMVTLAALPGLIVCGASLATIGLTIGLANLKQILSNAGPGSAQSLLDLSSPLSVMLLAGGMLLAFVPAIYFSICWMFTLALVADRDMDFWQAMQLSRSVVKKHWGSAFCLSLVIFLINVAGVLACCIGLLVSIPIGFGTFLYAYEDIFGPRAGQDS